MRGLRLGAAEGHAAGDKGPGVATLGAALVRIQYVLSHSIKKNLVARISDWEGLHCAQAMIDGKPMSGVWYSIGPSRPGLSRPGATLRDSNQTTWSCRLL